MVDYIRINTKSSLKMNNSLLADNKSLDSFTSAAVLPSSNLSSARLSSDSRSGLSIRLAEDSTPQKRGAKELLVEESSPINT